jgi:N6-adenosine-specific RNA methylase IME4
MTYSAIMADPPWHEPGGSGKGSNDHYDTLRSAADIARAMLQAPCWNPAPDAHLYLCTTMKSLPDGLWLVGALGFEYKTHAVWVKGSPDRLSIGTGQYFRGAHELVLFGTRGLGFAVRSASRSIPSVIFETPTRDRDGKRIHSRKPNALYELIESRTVGSRLEMFSRVARPGWDVWGNEAP